MSGFETNNDGTKRALDRCLDALDHIMRTAGNGTHMTRRLKWIAARCQSAIDGNEKWRDYDIPRDRAKQRENLRARLRELQEDYDTLLSLAIEWGESGEITSEADLRRILEDEGLIDAED